jgi:2-dehydropantoate 2-reductase
MRIVVVGAGGVGGYFGGRLAASGADVTFIARGRHLEALRRNGLKILSPRGDALVPNVKAVETIGEVQGADLVMVCVKLWDTEGVAAELGPLARNGAAIVSFQNGVEKDEVLGRHVPREAIIGGLCYIAASITEPGVIGHTGALQKLVFGEFDGKRSERCEAFLAACGQADVDAEIAGSIERLIWEKFVFLVGLSGTTSLFRSTIGPIREDPEKRMLLYETLTEVVAVGRAKGVPLAANFADEGLAFVDTLPPGIPSSMQVDLERGNRLEMPWLSGAVVDLGRKLGVPTPANSRIVKELTPFADESAPIRSKNGTGSGERQPRWSRVPGNHLY